MDVEELDRIAREIYFAMKRLGYDCSRYAPINMPRLECCKDNERVVIYIFKTREISVTGETIMESGEAN